MATVVSITNPITGAVEQVDKLDATAQQIDDAVALSTQLSNHNLLDNWYFANPVNQRGQAEYTGGGYAIDRWRNYSGIATIVESDGITLKYIGENAVVEQYVDADLTGATVTMSAIIDGVLYSGTKVVDTYDYRGAVSFPNGTLRVYFDGSRTVFRIWLTESDGTQATIKAAKLELGSQQTLAHKDADGTWILNEIPDCGEQLRRCQRYFQTFATQSLRPTDALDFRPVMRTTPALSTITVGTKTLYAASADL